MTRIKYVPKKYSVTKLLALSIRVMAEEFRVNPSRFFQYKRRENPREVKYAYLNYYHSLFCKKSSTFLFPLSLQNFIENCQKYSNWFAKEKFQLVYTTTMND